MAPENGASFSGEDLSLSPAGDVRVAGCGLRITPVASSLHSTASTFQATGAR